MGSKKLIYFEADYFFKKMLIPSTSKKEGVGKKYVVVNNCGETKVIGLEIIKKGTP